MPPLKQCASDRYSIECEEYSSVLYGMGLRHGLPLMKGVGWFCSRPGVAHLRPAHAHALTLARPCPGVNDEMAAAGKLEQASPWLPKSSG